MAASMWISGLVGSATLLIGFVALAAWKCYLVWQDKKEFKKFQRGRAKFSDVNNPLYKDPKTTVANPMMNQ